MKITKKMKWAIHSTTYGMSKSLVDWLYKYCDMFTEFKHNGYKTYPLFNTYDLLGKRKYKNCIGFIRVYGYATNNRFSCIEIVVK